MRSVQEEGLRLIREAEGIFRRDARGALREKDFNMAVRRAQEVVELTLKGALKILGVDYPRVHDVAPLFSEKIRQKRDIDDPNVVGRIEEISLWLAQSRTPSFYFDREYGVEDAERAFQDAAFVLA
jgi:HEPN domain-containing protein